MNSQSPLQLILYRNKINPKEKKLWI